MTHRLPHLASMEDIDHWADRFDARAELPNIVRRLIKGNNDTILELHMGGGSTVGFGGFDGRVVTTTASTFVPAGLSVWEMGVSRDPETKANSDYKKRTEDSKGIDRGDSTFVFVTPRLWAGAEGWAVKKRAEEEWKNVIAITAAELYSAMEDVPAVHVYFSELNGVPANGVRTLLSWWNAFISGTNDLLSPETLTRGRTAEVEALLRKLDQDSKSHIYIEAPSVDDVMAFVAAALIQAADAGHPEHLDRSLVVFEPGAMHFLGQYQKLLILIPFDDSLVRAAELATENAVIMRVGAGSPSQISLPRLPIAQTRELMVQAGVEEAESQRLALAGYRSVPLLRARLRGEPTLEADVATRALVDSSVARRLWLLGGWNADRTGDLEVIRGVIEHAFEGSELAQMTANVDPIFTRVGSSWRVIAPEVHLVAVTGQLSVDDLKRFEGAIQAVLGAVDPTLDLPQRERWKASLFGPGRLHSSDLRTGIATTLAAFGALGGDTQLQVGPTPRGWAALIVRALFQRANEDESGQLWLSLLDLLPLLAEAAPDEFIVALERELDTDGPFKSRLFAEVDDPMTSSSPHVYVLWGLETIAWSEDYLASAVELLARLVDLDPGGNLSNRPLRSLEDIFRPWLPQTAATLEQRLAVLRAVLRRHP